MSIVILTTHRNSEKPHKIHLICVPRVTQHNHSQPMGRGTTAIRKELQIRLVKI